MKTYKISTLFLISHIILVLITTLIFGGLWLYSYHKQTQNHLEQLQSIQKKLPDNTQLTTLIENKSKEDNNIFLKNILKISLIFLGIIFVVVLIIPSFQDWIKSDINYIQQGLQKPPAKIDINGLYFEDFHQLTTSLQQLLDEWIVYPKKQQQEYYHIFTQMNHAFVLYQLIQYPETNRHDYRFLMVNPAFERLIGRKSQDLLGKTIQEVFPNVELSWFDNYQQITQIGEPTAFEKFDVHSQHNFYISTYFPAPGYFACMFTDITETSKAEDRLRGSDINYHPVVTKTTAHICRWYPDSTLTYVNKAYADVYGKKPEDLLGTRWLDLLSNKFKAEGIQRLQQLTQQPQIISYEIQTRLHDQQLRWMLWTDSPIFNHLGQLVEFESIGQDITDRKRIEYLLEIKNGIAQILLFGDESQMYHQILHLIMEKLSSPYGIFGFFNERYDLVALTLNYNAEKKNDSKEKITIFPNHQWPGWWDPSLIEQKNVILNTTLPTLVGNVVIQRTITVPIHHANNVVGILIIANKASDYLADDMTILEEIAHSIAPILNAKLEQSRQESQRRKIEERLDQAHSLLRAALLESPIGILVAEAPTGKIKFVNNAAYTIRGRAKVSLTNIEISEHVKNWQMYDADGQTLYPAEKSPLALAIRDGISSENVEFIIRHEDGQNHWVSVNAAPIRSKDKQIIAAIMIFHDITQHKQAELEQQKLRERLQQGQKMESIGRLAAGVAHDFNNILGVIIGYLDLLEDGDGRSNEIIRQEYLQAIAKSTDDGKRLTSQLLAFSRKQSVNMIVADLNQIIKDFQKMLTRLTHSSIKLHYELDFSIGFAKVDTLQIDQILMNLAINACDAMPDGGDLTIQTSKTTLTSPESPDLPAKNYIVLTISDTGCGMIEETLRHIFEPFFTTKNKGTGLGLSTVYGIVKQHNGDIFVQSTPNKGTTFRIYFPQLSEAEAIQPKTDAKCRKTQMIKMQGTILLVEDEEGLLEMTWNVLTNAGFHVYKAKSVQEAMDIAFVHRGTLQLLLTDVIMPEKDGTVLASQIQKFCPDIKVLYMSGYTEDFLNQQKKLAINPNLFLPKPITVNVLLNKISEILGIKHTNTNDKNILQENSKIQQKMA